MGRISEVHEEFFNHLRALPGQLKTVGVEVVQIMVLLGNHDKPILTSPSALSQLYELVYGHRGNEFPSSYREWIGQLYFGDHERFSGADAVPWPPFYFADERAHYFATHGHWRDAYNSRRMKSSQGQSGWKVTDGWRLDLWKKLEFRPFTEPCFGDTVAAGVLSTFIYKARSRLREAGCLSPRLDQILGELDLYRPTYAAITRILKESRKERRNKGSSNGEASNIVESTVIECLREWLSWSFTLESATLGLRFWLTVARALIQFSPHVHIKLWLIRVLMRTKQHLFCKFGISFSGTHAVRSR